MSLAENIGKILNENHHSTNNGHYVVMGSTAEDPHNHKVIGKYYDSRKAIRHASRHEDETGRVTQVHHVGNDDKIVKSWQFVSDMGQGGGSYQIHHYWEGEDARHIVGKDGLATHDIHEASYSAKSAEEGHDIGKPGKNFKKIEDGAEKKYGKAGAARIAGSVLAKLRAKHGS